MGARDGGIAKNESLLRRVNEGIALAAVEHGRADAQMPFVCECPVLECGRILHLTLAQYGAVREHAAQFVVAPGHQIPGAEDVVKEHASYLVVEKAVGEADSDRSPDE